MVNKHQRTKGRKYLSRLSHISEIVLGIGIQRPKSAIKKLVALKGNECITHNELVEVQREWLKTQRPTYILDGSEKWGKCFGETSSEKWCLY